MKPTINGHYDPKKTEQEWQREKRDYTQCQYSRMCNFYRPVKLCLDEPDQCPVKVHTDLKTKKKLEGLVEEFPK